MPLLVAFFLMFLLMFLCQNLAETDPFWTSYGWNCCEIVLFSREDDGQRRSNQIGEEKELEKEADQENSVTVDRPAVCRPHTMGSRQACRAHTTEKKRDSDFRQAPVDRCSGLSTIRGLELDSDFLSGVFSFPFWWTPNRTQILFIEGCDCKDWRV